MEQVVTRCDFYFRKISLASLRGDGVGVEEGVKAETGHEVFAVQSPGQGAEGLN